jgi:anti-sigma B factor antagonist
VAIARPLEIEQHRDGEAVVLRLRGELDIATVPRLEDALEAALADAPQELKIDLRPLGFLDSSGLRQFILLADRAQAEGWRLVLIRPGQPTLSIFQITRAEENLPFVDAPEES